jgi:hypothetical protein
MKKPQFEKVMRRAAGNQHNSFSDFLKRNYQSRLQLGFHEVGITPADLSHYLVSSLNHKPKHKTLREAIQYKLETIQVERLIFIISL